MPVNRKALRKPKRIRASAFIAFGEPAMNSPMVEISLLQSKATVYDAIAAVVEKVRELTRMHTKGQSTGMHGYSVEDFFITVASDDEKHQFDPNLPLDPTRLLKEQVPSPCVLVLCVHPRLLAERKARSQNATAELRQVDLQHQLQKQLLEKRELKVQFIAQQRQEREEQQWQDSLAKDAMFRQHLSEERASEVSPAVRQQQQRRRKSQLRNGHIVEVLCSREVRAMYEADLHSQLMKRKEEEWLRIKAYEEAARSSVARSPKRGPARGGYRGVEVGVEEEEQEQSCRDPEVVEQEHRRITAELERRLAATIEEGRSVREAEAALQQQRQTQALEALRVHREAEERRLEERTVGHQALPWYPPLPVDPGEARLGQDTREAAAWAHTMESFARCSAQHLRVLQKPTPGGTMPAQAALYTKASQTTPWNSTGITARPSR
eukprot:RCo001035